MSRCCSSSCSSIEEKFDASAAQRDLLQYRKKGPGRTTRLLRDGVTSTGGPGDTLLDIGAGIGALTFELLERGVRRAVSVDASTAYVAAGREEAARRNCTQDVDWVHGDYVALADTLAPADTVTLDRVVCCYPRYQALLGAAAGHASRCIAISYPRDRWFVRIALAIENALHALRGSAFRVVLHPPREMEQVIRGCGFALAARHATWAWCADVYRKESVSA